MKYKTQHAPKPAAAKQKLPPPHGHKLLENKNVTYAKQSRHEKTVTPLEYRYQILEDKETGWGDNFRQLVGVYRKQHNGTYSLDDIRKTDLTELKKYPKTTFNVGPLPLSKPIMGLDEGQCCLFNWKFTFKSKINPCEIEVDESKPIVFIPPKDLITEVSKACKKIAAPENPAPRQTDVSQLIYTLMSRANRYSGSPVEVLFHLTDKYVSFQHTGRPLQAETILRYYGLGMQRNLDEETIPLYYSDGFRDFLLSNNHTIIISNGYMIRFDNEGGKLNVKWLEKADLPRDIKISISRNNRFKETIVVPFEEKDKGVQHNYKVGLHCVFGDDQNVAFYSNIRKVEVKINGEKKKVINRRGWVVSKEYQSFIPKEMRQDNITRKRASVIFACRQKGKALIGEDDAQVFCLLPTMTSFGFPFLMQADVHVNKTNYTINHRDPWNKVYAEIAGELFAKWIIDLSIKAEYTPLSIYNMVPKFDECIAEHPENKTFISFFQKGFKHVIMVEENAKKAEKPTVLPATSEHQTEHSSQSQSSSEHAGKTLKKSGKLYVVDTNIFVNCPNIIKKLGKDNIIILSAKVIDELDNLKYKLTDKDLRNVQLALKNINTALGRGNVRMEMSDVSLLPRDFDRHNPDNNILSVVLRHKTESPTLLTCDNGLQIKAKCIGINVEGLKRINHKIHYGTVK